MINNRVFPESCIEELINEYNSEIKANSIEDDYAILLYVVLKEWKNIVLNYVYVKEALLPSFLHVKKRFIFFLLKKKTANR